MPGSVQACRIQNMMQTVRTRFKSSARSATAPAKR